MESRNGIHGKMDGRSGSRKGFTLAELLIVVAVIAVLVAVAIPIFTSHLEKSRRAVDLANARTMKSILMNSYADGTIIFPGSTETVDNDTVNTYVAVIVSKNNVYYRASGTVRINGKYYNNGNTGSADHDGSFQRVKDLFASANFDNMHVHAKDTDKAGWASYAVILRSDGSCRIVSSVTNIDLGDGSGGKFERELERIMAEPATGIEKAMSVDTN